MRHGVKTVKLGRTASHRRSMLNNLASSVLRQGISPNQTDRAVVTTVTKAKAVRGLVDRLITYGKKGDLSARRQAAKFIREPDVLAALFETIGPRYQNRAGGYTRVLKLQTHRHGDGSQMAMIELVEDEVAVKSKSSKKSAPKAKPAAAPKAAAEEKVEEVEAVAETEAPAEEVAEESKSDE